MFSVIFTWSVSYKTTTTCSLKICRVLVTLLYITAVGSPDRVERDILEMVFDVFWPDCQAAIVVMFWGDFVFLDASGFFVVGGPLYDVGIRS